VTANSVVAPLYIPFRLIVFADKGANGTPLSSLNDLLTSFDLNGKASYSVESSYNTYNRGRFEILSNSYGGFWIVDINGGTPIPSMIHKQLFIDLRKKKMVTKYIEKSTSSSSSSSSKRSRGKNATSNDTGCKENNEESFLAKEQKTQLLNSNSSSSYSTSTASTSTSFTTPGAVGDAASASDGSSSTTASQRFSILDYYARSSNPPPSSQIYESLPFQHPSSSPSYDLIDDGNISFNIASTALYVAFIPLQSRAKDVNGVEKEIFEIVLNTRVAFL
jgi:hypothetical protein